MNTPIREFRTLRATMQANTILEQELTAIEGFDTACALAERARTLLSTVTAPQPVPWPTTADDLTEQWLNDATTFDTASNHAQARRELLTAVAANAERDAVNKAQSAGVATLRNLHTRLVDTLEQVTNLKALSGVHTAADAIVRGPDAVKAWEALAELAVTYDHIRDAQKKLMTLFFAEQYARFGNKQSRDPLASELQARNLDAVWGSNWRDRTDTPWPSDPVEKLLWLARSNAMPWVPTPGQLNQAAKERLEEARAAASQTGVTLDRPPRPAVSIIG